MATGPANWISFFRIIFSINFVTKFGGKEKSKLIRINKKIKYFHPNLSISLYTSSESRFFSSDMFSNPLSSKSERLSSLLSESSSEFLLPSEQGSRTVPAGRSLLEKYFKMSYSLNSTTILACPLFTTTCFMNDSSALQ